MWRFFLVGLAGIRGVVSFGPDHGPFPSDDEINDYATHCRDNETHVHNSSTNSAKSIFQALYDVNASDCSSRWIFNTPFPNSNETKPWLHMFYLKDDLGNTPARTFNNMLHAHYLHVEYLTIDNVGHSTYTTMEKLKAYSVLPNNPCNGSPHKTEFQQEIQDSFFDVTVNSIPTELGKFLNLKELRIRGQAERRSDYYVPSSSVDPFDDYRPRKGCENHFSLSATIPTELGELTNLEVLELHGLGLTGPIPTELGKLTNLKHLLLGHNGRQNATTQGIEEGLTGELSGDFLAQMPNLTALDITYNRLQLLNFSTHPSLKLVNMVFMGTNGTDAIYICGADTNMVTKRSDWPTNPFYVHLKDLLQNGNTLTTLNAAIDDLYNNFTNKSTLLISAYLCSDTPTTTTTITATSSSTSTTTSTSTITDTTTNVSCASYPTADRVADMHNITSTTQFEWCQTNKGCPCHLVFRNTDSQPVHGSFSDLTPLCLQLETLVLGANVFMSGTLRTLVDGGCTRLRRIVIEAGALLNVPLHVSDFHSLSELKILKISGGIYGSISAFEDFFNLHYADVSHGFLDGTPRSNFWTGVFARRSFDATDNKTLGTTPYPLQNLSTFATHNFLTATGFSYGAQFPSDLAPVYRYQRISPLDTTVSTTPSAAHSGGSVAGHDSSKKSKECDDPGLEIASLVILCVILAAAIALFLRYVKKGSAYEPVRKQPSSS